MNDLQLPSPILKVSSPLLVEKDVNLHIKREDMIHPTINGNKWRKLKYNIQHILDNNYETIMTFGGAFSNHIHSIAAVAKVIDIPCICIVRGEPDPLNPTTNFVKNQGVIIRYVSREDYRLKDKSPIIQNILSDYPRPYLVPEGGSNTLALYGLQELCEEIKEDYDMISIAAGTGCTAAGIIKHQEKQVLIFSALKSDYLTENITKAAGKSTFTYFKEDLFGGYGKTSPALVDFINTFYTVHNIPLDPIYNGKALYRLIELIRADYFPKGSNLLHIHTGGLQGIDAYNYMARKKNRPLLLQ